MGNKKLARHVTVAGTTYGPGDDVPADVMDRITNPKAWQPLDAGPPSDNEGEKPEPGTSSGARLATAVTVGARTYLPTDHVPDDVAAQIRNPKAWAGGKVPHAAAPAAPAAAATDDTNDGQPPPTKAAKAAAKAVPPAKTQ